MASDGPKKDGGVRLPAKGDRIAVPVQGHWLYARVSSPSEFGPAGHCPGYFAYELEGALATIGGCGIVGEGGPYDTVAEGRGWRFEAEPTPPVNEWAAAGDVRQAYEDEMQAAAEGEAR